MPTDFSVLVPWWDGNLARVSSGGTRTFCAICTFHFDYRTHVHLKERLKLRLPSERLDNAQQRTERALPGTFELLDDEARYPGTAGEFYLLQPLVQAQRLKPES